jgi:hypothetical protein
MLERRRELPATELLEVSGVGALPMDFRSPPHPANGVEEPAEIIPVGRSVHVARGSRPPFPAVGIVLHMQFGPLASTVSAQPILAEALRGGAITLPNPIGKGR